MPVLSEQSVGTFHADRLYGQRCRWNLLKSDVGDRGMDRVGKVEKNLVKGWGVCVSNGQNELSLDGKPKNAYL